MNRTITLAALALVAVAAVPVAASANARNSMQPAHVYFGAVKSGQHPNRIVTLHNGTGAPETVKAVAVAGAGGYVFTISANTAALAATNLPRCKPGLVLAAGARCAIDVHLHTVRVGWFRSVLRVTSTGGNFNSSELRAHVIP